MGRPKNSGITIDKGWARQGHIGMTRHPFYRRWDQMMDRCYNKRNANYFNYGGRGILVAEEFHNFTSYLAYIESLPGYDPEINNTVDRKDNDIGYQRGNLRWSNMSQQGLNRRMNNRNTSGYTGVSFNKKVKKWSAYITINTRQTFLGHYPTKEDARDGRAKYITDNKIEL